VKNDSIKNISVGFMIIFVVIVAIVFIVTRLISYWTSRPEPVTYIIENIIQNDKKLVENCDDTKLTIIKDVATNDVSYECGNLGQVNELITIYK
jgi:hypothetical protein